MAVIVVTQPGTIVAVSNGDTVRIDIPGGGDVTIVAAGANVRRFRIDYVDDTQSDTARVDLSTFSKDKLHIDARKYDTSDKLILEGAMGQGIEPGNEDEYPFDFVGATGQTLSGFVRIKDVGERDLTVNPPPIVICFAEGTVIDTALGPRPVETLREGDMVRTLDNGPQPVRWIGRRRIGADELAAAPHLAPVRIRAGALEGGLPWTDLTVSPQHRIRMADWRAALLYGQDEVLVPAKALVGCAGIGIAPVDAVTYFHLLFDRHELLWSNGVVSESLHPGEVAQSALADGASGAPEIADGAVRRTARPALRVGEARAARGYAA